MKNPQTTIAPTFLTHIISAIDGVSSNTLLCLVYLFLKQTLFVPSMEKKGKVGKI